MKVSPQLRIAGGRGVSTVEYAFLILLIALAIFSVVATTGTSLRGQYDRIREAFSTP